MNAPPMLCPVGPELLVIEHKITTAEKLRCMQNILLSVAALEEQSEAVLTEAWKLLTRGQTMASELLLFRCRSSRVRQLTAKEAEKFILK